jgi:RNA polymerase sigma-70 factor (ECF subfamily)
MDGDIERYLAQAKQVWPSVELDPEVFAAHVRSAGPQDGANAADLYLACACLQGVPEALRLFESAFLGRIEAAVRPIDAASRFADEVRSHLRQSLLVGDGTRGPALADYRGRGALWGWVRVSAVRAALKLRRGDARKLALEEQAFDAVLSGARDDPEVDHLRSRFGREFREAFDRSFGGLPAEARTLLLQHYVDGLTTEQLGGLHRVHRVTISRRLVRARRELLDGTRAALMDRLQLSPSECDSVIRIVRSQLDITLERYRPPPRPTS